MPPGKVSRAFEDRPITRHNIDSSENELVRDVEEQSLGRHSVSCDFPGCEDSPFASKMYDVEYQGVEKVEDDGADE